MSSSRKPRRVALIVVVATTLAVVAALGVAYATGVFVERGRFTRAPACDVLDPAVVAPIVPDAGIEAEGDGCRADNGETQLSVTFTVVAGTRWVGGPETASHFLRRLAGADAVRLPDVGDEAVILSQGGATAEVVTMRVSNLIAVVAVSSLTADGLRTSMAEPTRRLAADLAARLASDEAEPR